MQLGPVGVWSGLFRTEPRAAAREAAAELEDLGVDAIWVPGGGAADILEVMTDLLGATEHVVLASGILNIWMHDPRVVAAEWAELSAQAPRRALLGLGVSHAPMVEATNRRYERPRSVMVEFLDALDASPTPVPRDERVLAALGPRMLELARQRSAGAHPYCVPVEHTAEARSALGEHALLAPEVKAVLTTDRDAGMAIARSHLERYFHAANYVNNLRRLGYEAADLADGGSDRLVAALVAVGDVDAIVERVRDHRDAGADHVCIQALSAEPGFPLAAWRAIVPALRSSAAGA